MGQRVILARARGLLLLAVLAVTMLTTVTPMRHAGAAAKLSDETVQKLLMIALDQLGRGLCENNKPCAPATAEEKANPPITIDEARIVVQRGALSTAAEHCGLDWRKRNFTPMMAYLRRKLKKNERQLALIAILHGITQEFGKAGFKAACTDELRKNVDRQLTFQP